MNVKREGTGVRREGLSMRMEGWNWVPGLRREGT